MLQDKKSWRKVSFMPDSELQGVLKILYFTYNQQSFKIMKFKPNADFISNTFLTNAWVGESAKRFF